ncbi:MAG: inner membrane protein [Clostridiales bacterium]|nr:inner membrane protein [Clostridiales bacterium]
MIITLYVMFTMMDGPLSLYFILGGIIGSFLPDCDIATAPAGWFIPAWIFVKHRTITHSVLAVIVISAIAYIINRDFGSGIFIGYALHLIADAMTKMGLPYFWYPIKYNKVKPYTKRYS